MPSLIFQVKRLTVLITVLAAGGVLLCLDANVAQQRDDDIGARPLQSDIEEFMARKLKAAQLTLEAVMTSDFEVIRDQSASMVDLSRHAAWKQMASATYVQDTADFVTAAEFFNRMAAAGDAVGVSVAYSQLVQSCTTCHQHVRAPRVAMLQPLYPPARSLETLSSLALADKQMTQQIVSLASAR